MVYQLSEIQRVIENVVTDGIGYHERYEHFDETRGLCYEFEKRRNIICCSGDSLFEWPLIRIKLAMMDMSTASSPRKRALSRKYVEEAASSIAKTMSQIVSMQDVYRAVEELRESGVDTSGLCGTVILPEGEISFRAPCKVGT